MFYIDVLSNDSYDFYYNMVAEINKSVYNVLGSKLDDRPITKEAESYVKSMRGGNFKGSTGPAHFGVIGSHNRSTDKMEYISAEEMVGIYADVRSLQMAEAILERAVYYCPKDTGTLAKSARIVHKGNGKYVVLFDCYYAWYVHEYTWKAHKFPTCAKFLSRAVYEVEKEFGIPWA